MLCSLRTAPFNDLLLIISAMSNPNKYKVYLSQEQRQYLKDISCNESDTANKILRARVLLFADQNNPEGGWTDEQIGTSLGLHAYTIARIRKRFVMQGIASALNRQVHISSPKPTKLDGENEARLICYSPAPDGHSRWTLSLLVKELKTRKIVTSISRETVRKVLRKNNYDFGQNRPYIFHKKMHSTYTI
jgi:transposase